MSASPAMAGGDRGPWALRVPLEHLGARLYSEMFSLAQSHRALTEDGTIADDRLASWLVDTIGGFLDLGEAGKHYPCIRRDWAECLGEPWTRPPTASNRTKHALHRIRQWAPPQAGLAPAR